MRSSIQAQIAVPIIAVLSLMIVLSTLLSAWTAGERARAQSRQRLESTLQAVRNGSYPLTSTIVEDLHELSGLHLIVIDSAQRIRTTSFASPALVQDEVVLEALNGTSRDKSLRVQVGSEFYYGTATERRDGEKTATVLVLASERLDRAALWSAVWPPLSVGVVSWLVAIGFSYWVSHRISRRFKSLSEQLRPGAHQELPRVVISPPQDELFELASRFNLLSNQLEQIQQAMQRSERVRLLNQIASGMLHQLRNSATGAKLALDVHLRRNRGPANDEALGVVRQQLDLIERFLQNLFALTRNRPMLNEPGLVQSAIEKAVELLRPMTEHQHVTLEANLYVPNDLKIADWSGLHTAIINLLTNAIEAAGRDGIVEIRASFDGKQIEIEVSDSGDGPDTKVGDTIFEPLVTTKPEGLGIGLSQVKQWVLQAGGNVQWSRRDERTVFLLEFPAYDSVPLTAANN